MVERLGESVWWVDCGGVNAFLVADDALTLVDAGMPGDAGTIRAAVREAGFTVDEVERVLLTHYDYDHVGALPALSLDATVYAHPADAALLLGTRAPPLSNQKGLLQRVAGLRLSAPDVPVETVTEGDTVGSFSVYHTPGHSPGHLAFVSEELGVGVLGDLVREKGGRLRRPPWFFNYDSATVAASVVDLAARAPPFEVACVGHGEPLATGGRDALVRLAGTLD